MDFEAIQRVWTTESGGTTMPDEKLIRDVMARDGVLTRRVRLRDLIELVTAIGMAGGFLWVSFQVPTPWPWWLAAAITAGVGAVFVRERRRRGAVEPAGRGVRAGLKAALAETDHQIRLLRSVAWWYLLPLGGAALLVLGGTVMDVRSELPPDVWARGRAALAGTLGAAVAIVVAVFGFVWWLNQHAVRTQLEPHRERLAALVRQLEASGVGED